MVRPCRKDMCYTCAKNFDRLIDGLFRHLYPDVYNIKTTFDRYSMRNDSKKLTKIIQKFLSLTDYVNTNSNLLIIFPNKFIDYDLSHLESRLSATERFIFDNTVSQNEALFQLPTILRATLCECCYTETRDNPIFMKELYRLYYRCSCVNNLFNYLIKGSYLIPELDKACKSGKPVFSNVVKSKLMEFQSKTDEMINPDWKGSDYYFRKLFGVPIYLSGIIPEEHFQKFHSGYITDVIAGHPLASNGWMKEAMDDMDEMGVFT